MTVSMRDVRAVLDPDEVDYTAGARLGPEALEHLLTLVTDTDPGLAAKAAYLAGKIRGDRSEEVLAAAAASEDALVRVAAASAAALLGPDSASRVLTDLVVDADSGVQKLALRSVPSEPSAELRSRVRDVSASAAEPGLRLMADNVLRGLR
ncbi:hypothetical protein D6T64_07705 [Cryobacterium melibiosiphilum]|uniref:HEAT repeat domain-containing protein n=1 Tax=Cryobacterium melibiosiphilum TaxID=995039 RepID=A0A3A5MJP9_9MICO|nr:HEAT repeat domain-containing protein [Cryobacterium melibiosiphilum]RJT89141.1 hypothetical protein D6T64_07705 [Cryobacterium melibiosiphilum]